MGVKLCLVPGCMQPTAGTRCPAHEAAWQRDRNARRGPERTVHAPYRKVSLDGQVCACCGTDEDLTRHHVGSLAAGDWTGVLVAMCRRCNSSIGQRQIDGLKCPMHGGRVIR
jgi:hypothetical protein